MTRRTGIMAVLSAIAGAAQAGARESAARHATELEGLRIQREIVELLLKKADDLMAGRFTQEPEILPEKKIDLSDKAIKWETSNTEAPLVVFQDSHISYAQFSIQFQPGGNALQVSAGEETVTITTAEIMAALLNKPPKPDQCPVCGTMAEPFYPTPRSDTWLPLAGQRQNLTVCEHCNCVFSQPTRERAK